MVIRKRIGSVDIKVDLSRVEGNLKEAQKLLNLRVTGDCEPLVPKDQGALRGSVRYPEGVDGGQIMYDTPYAHYQYVGTVYGPNIPIKDGAGNITGWGSPPKKAATNRRLTYHEPGTSSEWFEKAKAQHKQEWIELVEQTVKKRK